MTDHKQFLHRALALSLVLCALPSTALAQVDSDGDGYDSSVDCDDSESSVYPGATELCDGLDNDCDGAANAGGVFTYQGTGGTIPAFGWATLPINVNETATVRDVNLTVDISAGVLGDINIYLVGPTGTTVEVSTDNGDGNADYDNTTFDDEATTPITSGTAPFSGTYQPEYPLDALDLTSALGSWTLRVYDDGGQSPFTPTVNSWSLELSLDSESDDDGDGYVRCSPWVGSAPSISGGSDCNDQDPSLTPEDGDGDSYSSCTADCNDNDAAIHPGAMEVCNGLDDDCDGVANVVPAVVLNGGGAAIPNYGWGYSSIVVPAVGTVGDVNVTVNASHSLAGELNIYLDGIDLSSDNGGGGDNYINTVFDDEATTSIVNGIAPFTGSYQPEQPLSSFDGSDAEGTWTLSVYDDGGGPTGALNSWTLEIVIVETDDDLDGVYDCSDCDDDDPANFPGNTEVCDGQDNDCNGLDDMGLPGFSGEETDNDGDGQWECEGDCDDTIASNFTGNTEVCDGQDNDCSGFADFDLAGEVDGDGDGELSCSDCDDGDVLNFTGNIEVCDGQDNDCDSATDENIDFDGDGQSLCAGDCDETEVAIYLGNTEVCDGLDNDCDPANDELSDVDGDGQTLCGGDCGPLEPTIYPGAPELCDGLDNDCNGSAGEFGNESDDDGDGQWECQGDCDDTDIANFSGNPELCDGQDNDCNGLDDMGNPGVSGEETDGDSDGQWECQGDCDDTNIANFTGNTEICDGQDNDCDGTPNYPDETVDDDGDGDPSCSDCDDADVLNFTGNSEVCDGQDNDCNGLDDMGNPGVSGEETDDDGDGQWECQGDCDDADALNFDGNPEVCDGQDNDCDGMSIVGSPFSFDGPGGTVPNYGWYDSPVVVPSSFTVIDVNVEVDFTHDLLGDLNIYLLGPNGTTQIDLSSDNGYSGDNYAGTIFDDEASVSITAGSAPFSGSYQPEQALTAFDGMDSAGTWTLLTYDDGGGTAGTLNNWSLILTEESFEEIDGDGDGFLACNDCDDSDDSNYPGNTEICDGQDNDCDTATEAAGGEADADGDGDLSCSDCDDNMASNFSGNSEICDGLDNNCNGLDDMGNAGVGGEETDDDGDGQWECQGDCDDTDIANFTGNTELCDGQDNDCNGLDDMGNPGVAGEEADDDGDGQWECQGDCDDTNITNFAGNPELCDGLDNDCNGLDDMGNAGVGGEETDDDGDGQWECQGDCDDTNIANFTGNTELCDGQDNDCNGLDDMGNPGVAGEESDGDGDGQWECQGDCDDTNIANFMGNTETCDGQDNDCVAGTWADGAGEIDSDLDGSLSCEDCDDSDALNLPGGTEVCDGQDNDCDGTPNYPDETVDDDGDGAIACAECDDSDPANFPGNIEICDGQNNDCDPATAEDVDGDGDGQTVCDGDCDDLEASVYLGNLEICDGLDNDCDSANDETGDQDGDGETLCDGDCDDLNPQVYASAPELCDGLDNDCDGEANFEDEDTLEDESDFDGDGYLGCADDCDDDDLDFNPGATELCDGLDNDCDGAVLDEEEDDDLDGWTPCEGDCNDKSAVSYPGAGEVCDGLDNNCDDMLPDDELDADGDSWMSCGGDCNDASADASPAGTEASNESCDDGLDNDCDGDVDLNDDDCQALGDDDDDDDDDDDEEEASACGSDFTAGSQKPLSPLLFLSLTLGMFLRRNRRIGRWL